MPILATLSILAQQEIVGVSRPPGEGALIAVLFAMCVTIACYCSVMAARVLRQADSAINDGPARKALVFSLTGVVVSTVAILALALG